MDASKFAFSYEPSVSEEVRTAFIDACAPSGDAATRDQLSAFVDQMTPEFRQQIMDQGFPDCTWRADNLSDVIASAVLVAFQIVQDLTETTPAQDNAVRDLIRVAMVASRVAALPDAEKQKQGEMLMLATVPTVVQLESARETGNAKMLDRLKAAGRDVLAGFGLHPAIFELGPDGLETSAKFKEVAPRIEAGTTTFKAEFPEAAADSARLGVVGTPALPPVAATAPVTPLPPDTSAFAVVVATARPSGGALTLARGAVQRSASAAPHLRRGVIGALPKPVIRTASATGTPEASL